MMNRPHAVGTLLVRLEDSNGREDSDNSTREVAMESRNPPRRKWWSVMGNKEDRFVWQGGDRRNNKEEVLYKPNFEYDAEQIIANDRETVSEDGSVHNESNIEEKKQRIIDQRIDALSSLFTSRRYDDRRNDSGYHRDDSGIRATDLTDDEFIDFVLNGTQSIKENIHEADEASTSKHEMQQIIQKYQECREKKRNSANTYITDRRSILPEPWVERDDVEQSSVQIDRHGRLVRTRRESEEVDADNQSSTDDIAELELVDAAEVFWRQHKKSNDGEGLRGGGRRVASTASNASDRPPLPAVMRPQQPPLPQNQLNQQHIRERAIAQQMENESRQAIERAIRRYREEQQDERDEAIFEMVDIPLIRPINEVNAPRWLRFLTFNRQRRAEQQAANNDNADRNPNEQQNEQQDHHDGEGDWIDLRLALRRICFAVITVAAAFICMMLQGLPIVDFGDDGMELHPIILSGLMGPHYHGHHPQYHRHHHHHHQQQQQQHRQFMEALEEVEANDIQQSIWNRLGIEESYYLSRDTMPEMVGQSSNQGEEEL